MHLIFLFAMITATAFVINVSIQNNCAPTSPPNSTLTLTCYQLTVKALGEG